MAGDVLSFMQGAETDHKKAEQIAAQFIKWDGQRANWKETTAEIQEYLHAIDTYDTENNTNGWNNSTHLPKLCQIRDNLYANYQTGLFPNDQWLRWEYEGTIPEEANKKSVIEGYMVNKTRNPEFREVVNQLLLDYIDYGNAYAYAEYVKITREEDGEEVVVFEGPVPRRIDPNDIVYNPVASSWEETPCIVRSVMTEGDLSDWASRQSPDVQAKVAKVLSNRSKVKAGELSSEDANKAKKITLAGLGSITEYLTGDTVEVLTFYGNYWDATTNTLHKNQKIIVVDRYFVLVDEGNPSWVGKPITHVPWRRMPGNLMGMSVLANLLGMQYRINHLENMKADALDLNVYPPFKVLGNVPEFTYAPGERLHIPNPDEGDIVAIPPDLRALQLDLEIQTIMDWMEEFAGAPKESMGFRTPGEKTAFEVQQLTSSSGRVFQEKITNFEVKILEPTLNLMLSEAKNTLAGGDLALVFDELTQASEFVEIGPSDIRASGKIKPIGARHFSEQRQLIQNLVGIMNSPLGPKLMPHMDGYDLAQAVENALGIEKWRLFAENAGIIEQAEQQQKVRELQAYNDEVASTELGGE